MRNLRSSKQVRNTRKYLQKKKLPPIVFFMSDAQQSTPKKATPTPPKQTLADLVKTLQFAWFVGHVVTFVATLMYALTYLRVFPSSYKFWYKLALAGVVESFGILVFQSVKKNGAKLSVLLSDDNVHYLLLGLGLFFFSPYVLLTLTVYILFSTFHVLSYAKHYLLPVLNIPETHPVSVKIGNFVAANNASSIQWAALLEVATLGWLFLRVLTFRSCSVIPFLLYVVFIKLRFEKSAFTRSAFKSLEMRVESSVNSLGNPKAKDIWIQVKGVFHKVALVHVAHDYTKEKST